MPTIDIPDKICSHCGGTLWYYREKQNNYYSCNKKQKDDRKAYLATPEGKAKHLAHVKNYHKRNKEKLAKYQKDFYEKNKEKYKIYSHKYRQTEKGKAALKRAKNKQSENLTDYYIINSMYVQAYHEGFKIDRKAITPTQIERYRTFIKLQREVNPKQFKTRKHEKNIESKKSKKIAKN
jgi:hypothetical protein